MMRTTGQLVQIGSGADAYRAFVPEPLPPRPPLKLTAADHDLLERANRALGKLDGMTSLLPDTSLFIYAYVRKEALVSSQIEGTQSSLSDLLLYESDQAPGVPLEDVREVSDYVAALDHGLERLRGGFPLSLRLVREIDGVLLRSGRGKDKTRASSAAVKSGSEARVRAAPVSCPRRPTRSSSAWGPSRSSSTEIRSKRPRS